MSRLRSRYNHDFTKFSGEVINEVHVTVPDLALTIEDIFKLAMDGVDPALEFVPDTSYFEDLTDILPNIDELGVITPPTESTETNEASETTVKPDTDVEEGSKDDNVNPT